MFNILYSESASEIIINTEETADTVTRASINPLIFYGFCIGVFVLIILVILLFLRQNGLQRKYDLFMRGKSGKNLEEALSRRVAELDNIKESNELMDLRLKNVERSMSRAFQKYGIVNYDAFKELGGKLSFAYAVLDEENSGYIMNSIHSREGCYTYIKEIIKGESYISLSEEEKDALEMALNSNIPEPTKKSSKASRARAKHTEE